MNEVIYYLTQNQKPILFSVSVAVFYMITRLVANRLIKNQAKKDNYSDDRKLYMKRLISILLLLLSVTILGAVWEISFQGLSLFFASIFTVVGVALFATWSILSNLTASIFLFFFFPYRIGQKVKIMDGDNSLEGLILDINLFYVKIETNEGNIVAYPNNLAIQKPIIIRFK